MKEPHDTHTPTHSAKQFFDYINHEFINWNAKADGSEISYSVIDTVFSGTSLYAQWTKNYFIGDSSLGFLTSIINVYVDSKQKLLMSSDICCGNLTYSSSDYFYISMAGTSDWSVCDGCFNFDYNNHTYNLSITMSDASTETCIVTTGEYVGMSFDASGQQSVTFTIALIS